MTQALEELQNRSFPKKQTLWRKKLFWIPRKRSTWWLPWLNSKHFYKSDRVNIAHVSLSLLSLLSIIGVKSHQMSVRNCDWMSLQIHARATYKAHETEQDWVKHALNRVHQQSNDFRRHQFGCQLQRENSTKHRRWICDGLSHNSWTASVYCNIDVETLHQSQCD